MLKKVRNKFYELKLRVKCLIDSYSSEEIEPRKVEITTQEYISKVELIIQEDFTKVEIKDYITASEYGNELKNSGYTGTLEQISFNIMWNSRQQKINKGSYYVIVTESGLYNVFIDGNKITIDERIKVEDLTEEKIIRYDSGSKTYRYTSFKHDIYGSTCYMKFYGKDGVEMKGFELDKELAFKELSTTISNLEKIDVIGNIVDLESLKESILGDFGVEFLGESKKKV